jgi:hypothetical protein
MFVLQYKFFANQATPGFWGNWDFLSFFRVGMLISGLKTRMGVLKCDDWAGWVK